MSRSSRKSVPEIANLASTIKDNNYRIFTAEGEVHLVSHRLHLHDADPFNLMEQLRSSGPDGGLPKNLDPGHAFYLGYEMCKALMALTLGKTYEQDESLNWGLATRPETTALPEEETRAWRSEMSAETDQQKLPLVTRPARFAVGSRGVSEAGRRCRMSSSLTVPTTTIRKVGTRLSLPIRLISSAPTKPMPRS